MKEEVELQNEKLILQKLVPQELLMQIQIIVLAKEGQELFLMENFLLVQISEVIFQKFFLYLIIMEQMKIFYLMLILILVLINFQKLSIT